MSIWDRIKFLLLLGIVWLLLVWSVMANNPLVGFSDAVRTEVRTGWWVFVLLVLEFLRQVHFFISERSAGYHNFWVNTFFGGFERSTHRRISDWSRFRISRVLTWVFWIAIIAIVTQGHPHHADPGPAPRASAHLARAAVRDPDRVHAPVRRAPVRRPVLVHVPRRGRRLLSRRHQDPVL